MPINHHLAGDSPERGVCGNKHQGQIVANRDEATCSYCLHLTEHGQHTPMSGIALAMYELGNRDASGTRPRA